MIVDIRKLNATKAYCGSMQFDYVPEDSFIEIPFVQLDGPVKVEFDYELFADDSLEIRGKVKYRLLGQCSRCLRDAEEDVEGDLEAYFLPTPSDEDYFYADNKVDVTEAVRDAIMACLPFSLSCKKDDCQMIYYDPEK